MTQKNILKIISVLLFIFISFNQIFSDKVKGKLTNEERKTQNKLAKEYLLKHYNPVDMKDNDDYSSFSMLDCELKKNIVFLSGEVHCYNENYQIKLKLLKYFYKKGGVRYFFMEAGYSYAYFFNKYLKTGDINIFNRLWYYSLCYGDYGWNCGKKDAVMNFFYDLYDFNNNLEDDKKIKFVCVDLDENPFIVVWHLYEIISTKTISPKLSIMMKDLTKFYTDSMNLEKKVENEYKNDDSTQSEKLMRNNVKNMKKYLEYFIKLQKDIVKKKYAYKKFLKDDFFDFSMAVDNAVNSIQIQYGLKYSSSEYRFYPQRERNSYNNFKKLYKFLPKAKYYGQFGDAHVYQRETMGGAGYNDKMKYFACLLDTDVSSPVKGRVLSININYNRYNTYVFSKSHSRSQWFGTFLYNIFGQFQDDYYIFKLNGKKSPITSDYFQYDIFVNKVKKQ